MKNYKIISFLTFLKNLVKIFVISLQLIQYQSVNLSHKIIFFFLFILGFSFAFFIVIIVITGQFLVSTKNTEKRLQLINGKLYFSAPIASHWNRATCFGQIAYLAFNIIFSTRWFFPFTYHALCYKLRYIEINLQTFSEHTPINR